jgi:3-isopropylmalate dehydrogenase
MYEIAVIPGDGIGQEVTDEALKVLQRLSEIYGFRYKTHPYPWGADHYLATGEMMPDSILDEYRQMNAILLGAIGDPRIETGMLEFNIIMGVRFGLDLYLNLRPIKLYAEHLCPLKDKKPEDVDFMVVRENTEGLYSNVFGFHRKGTPNEIAIQQEINTRMGVERAIRYAYELTRKRNRKKRLTMVDKANALRAQDIWTRTFAEVGREYPDIEQDHAYVDAMCMWMVKNPEWFDVVVVGNMFGDIITDLGAMIQGGMGIAASGNLHPGKVSMFEPIHGSAPKYRGKGVANPLAAIASVQMMLDYVGEEKAAEGLEGAVAKLLRTERIPSVDARSGLRTQEIGDLVCGALAEGVEGMAAER